MKKYIVFYFDDHYPDGGMHDLVASFDSFEEALACCKEYVHSTSNYQIVDRDTWEEMDFEV